MVQTCVRACVFVCVFYLFIYFLRGFNRMSFLAKFDSGNQSFFVFVEEMICYAVEVDRTVFGYNFIWLVSAGELNQLTAVCRYQAQVISIQTVQINQFADFEILSSVQQGIIKADVCCWLNILLLTVHAQLYGIAFVF